MAPCQPCGPCPSYGLHQHCKSGNRRFLVKKRIPRAFLNFWGLSVNMDNPKGPRGVFSNCGDDFLSRRLILVLRVQYGPSLRPLGHPEGPQGAFSSCWAQYLSRDLFYYYELDVCSLDRLKLDLILSSHLGLTVMSLASHPDDPGSIPGWGNFFL